jgi:hypothetical protein
MCYDMVQTVRSTNCKWLLIFAGTLIVALLAGWLWLPAGSPTGGMISQSGNTNTTADLMPNWDEKLRGAVTNLAGSLDVTGKNRVLALFRQALASGSTNEVSSAIRRFLDSKIDAPTGQGFKVGQHGFLTEAPTLRTWLLDYLAQIDPSAAAEYAKVILNSKDSPDEWALALRNLALGDTSADGRALLEQKTAEMLQYEPWQQNPSTGFLEAFDTAVYLGGTNLMPFLTNLVRLQDNPAVAHASYLALDRMVINNPTMTLTALLADPALMQGRETTRANYFARADVRDPVQKQVLENYLLNSQTSPAEIEAFAGIFPNANYMISPNLLTQSQTPDRAALVSRDAASLSVVQGWMTDPQFAQLLPNLEKLQTRLAGYVQQENQ